MSTIHLLRVAGLTLFMACVAVAQEPAPAVEGEKPKAKAERPKPDPVGEPIVYKKVDGRELKLYVVKPEGWKPADKRPGLVLIHGGGWKGGYPGLHNNQAQVFAGRGMVAVIVEYRLLGKGNKTDPPTICCQDAKSAMRYVRGHARELGIDPDRIAASGTSAGGHLSAFVGIVDGMDDPSDDLSISAKPNALLLICPVVDVSPRVFNHARFGERWKEFSPLEHVSDKTPPTLVVIGDQDQYIKMVEIDDFRDALKKHNVRCDVIVLKGHEHGFFTTPRVQGKVLGDCDEFLVSLGWLPPAAPTTRSAEPASRPAQAANN